MGTTEGYGRRNEELTAARERFTHEWLALRESLQLEAGTEPRWRLSTILPVLAFAVGAAVGAGIWWRRRGD